VKRRLAKKWCGLATRGYALPAARRGRMAPLPFPIIRDRFDLSFDIGDGSSNGNRLRRLCGTRGLTRGYTRLGGLPNALMRDGSVPTAFFAIPGIGPVLVACPLVAWIVGALEGAVVVGGLGAVGAGLHSIGIPKDSVVKYETAIKSDKFLILAHGTTDEVARAKNIIQTNRPAEVAVHAVERA